MCIVVIVTFILIIILLLMMGEVFIVDDLLIFCFVILIDEEGKFILPFLPLPTHHSLPLLLMDTYSLYLSDRKKPGIIIPFSVPLPHSFYGLVLISSAYSFHSASMMEGILLHCY